MDGWDRARFERILGNTLAACRNEIGGVPALSKVIEEWDNEEPRGRAGRARKKGRKISETPVKDVIVPGRRAEENFIAFWNSFENEGDETIRLYLDMLDRSGVLARSASAIADGWRRVYESNAWKQAKRLGVQYLVLLAVPVVLAVAFAGSTIFLGLEQYRWVALAFFAITAGLLTLVYALAFPINRLMEEVAELLQEKEDERSWQARKALIKRRVGQLAFAVLVLLLVPFVEHPEYLVALALALVVVTTLAGWKRTLAVGVVAVITAVALTPTARWVYDEYLVPAWEWVAEREAEPPPAATQAALSEGSRGPASQFTVLTATKPTEVKLLKTDEMSPLYSAVGGTDFGWHVLSGTIVVFVNGRVLGECSPQDEHINLREAKVLGPEEYLETLQFVGVSPTSMVEVYSAWDS
ncbi:hypothetical protein L0Y40_02320 [Candidatus Wolfebacteria bacterium]|nr:hypothetical protein [Candidatus Wolfebacteria bacterium]